MSDHEPGSDHRTEKRTVHRDPLILSEGNGDGGGLPRCAEDRVLDILEVIGDAHFLLDRNWRFVYLSPNALRHARLPESELLGQVLWEKYPELLGTPVETHYRRAVAEGRMVQFETPGFLSGRWFEVYAAPLPDGLAVYSRIITTRKQAEEALRESEERHRAIAELTSDYTYSCRLESDGQAVFESASAGFRQVTGFTVEEVQARGGWLSLIHPEDRPRTQELAPLLSSRGSTSELRIITKQGETRWIRFSARIVGERGPGREARLVGAVQDITDRRVAEDALRASEELNRRIIEALPGGMVQVALDGTILAANAETCRVLGLRWDERLRRFVHDFSTQTLREDGSPCPVEEYPVTRCLHTGRPQPPATIGVRRPDGLTSWGVFTAVPLLAPETGHPSGAIVTFLDITERRQMEQALRESEERLRRFFEAGFEGIAIHENGVIVDANQSLADMLGYPLAELIGMHVLDCAAPESREEVRRHLLARDEQPYEATGRRRDGSLFPGEVRGKSITYHGRTARVTVMRDITRRKQTQKKLQEYAQRLQGLSRRLLEVQELERRHLARELHDEIGQVLTGLRLTLERNRLLPAEELRASLAETQKFVRELTAQVRDLSLRLRPTMLDDFGLLATLLWHFERYSAQTGVRVSFEHRGLELRLAPEVETAGYRIIQEALTNVARHAEVAGCVVRVWLDKGALYLQVEDTGRGFDAERVLRRGTSSGLSGMQERVELLGGRFAVESAPGGGTHLFAELPVQVAAANKREGSEPGAGP
jgi:PAS domain S-box-containing protein